MSKFDRKKIAVALAFASLFGSKTSQVKSPQALGAVGGATSRNNSNLLADPIMLKKSKGMSNLTKGLTGVGIAMGVVGFANEVMGAFTNAEAWYKGKVSIANFIKYLLAPTFEQRIALFTKVNDILNSFNKEITEEESQRIVVSPGFEKQYCLNKVKNCLMFLAPEIFEEAKNEMNKKPKKDEEGVIAIADGCVLKAKGMCVIVKYGDDSIALELKWVVGGENIKAKAVYTMNKDGSLTVEYIETKNGKKEEWKAKFMPENKAPK